MWCSCCLCAAECKSRLLSLDPQLLESRLDAIGSSGLALAMLNVPWLTVFTCLGSFFSSRFAVESPQGGVFPPSLPRTPSDPPLHSVRTVRTRESKVSRSVVGGAALSTVVHPQHACPGIVGAVGSMSVRLFVGLSTRARRQRPAEHVRCLLNHTPIQVLYDVAVPTGGEAWIQYSAYFRTAVHISFKPIPWPIPCKRSRKSEIGPPFLLCRSTHPLDRVCHFNFDFFINNWGSPARF